MQTFFSHLKIASLGGIQKRYPIFGYVGFQKFDITMLPQTLQWVIIGDGWVGRSKNGLKNRISFVDGP